ncbi:MAG: T9SS type A sorting domain-containing protein, partial [Fimbriimonadaceae bacterium]|nr:T9SS type A sorting domain-containing protein [Chitinophagales bacterium]
KSTSNGDAGSWTRTRIIDFPIEGFDGNTISDVDGDEIADTIGTTDGTASILIDNAGMMHVWAGATNLLDVVEGDNLWSYFGGVTGMWYWNESFGTDSIQYLDIMLDWDGDGDRFAGIGFDIPVYGIGLTSQPTPALDPTTGNIYVMFTQPVENTDFEGDPSSTTAQSFRDIFGIYTTDGGATWSDEVNLTYVAKDFYENVFPSTTTTTVGDIVHALWWQDQDPGNAFEGDGADPIASHDIVYKGWDFSRFDPYNPTADFTFNVSTDGTGSVTFTNLSVDADTYNWFFDDGETSASNSPVHIYDASDEYEVCLTATNVYGFNASCKTISINVGIMDVVLNNALQVYPSPSNGNVNISINSNAFGVATIEVHNMLGELMNEPVNYNTEGNKELNVDLTNLANGNYMVKVISDNGSVAVRQITIVK